MTQTDRRVSSLQRQLDSANRQIQLLQAETRRWQRLVPPQLLDLMGVYPPLRRLLIILVEAADLQDPSRGARFEDTARSEFVNVGEHASTSQTEAAVLTHRRARQDVRSISRELETLRRRFTEQLDNTTHLVGSWIAGSNGEYQMPDPPVCHRKDCRMRGRQQSHRAWRTGCEGCGRGFTPPSTLGRAETTTVIDGMTSM